MNHISYIMLQRIYRPSYIDYVFPKTCYNSFFYYSAVCFYKFQIDIAPTFFIFLNLRLFYDFFLLLPYMIWLEESHFSLWAKRTGITWKLFYSFWQVPMIGFLFAEKKIAYLYVIFPAKQLTKIFSSDMRTEEYRCCFRF